MTTPSTTPTPNPSPASFLTPRPGRPTGPRTDEGKETASQNSLAHGLRTDRPVVGDEREDHYLAYVAANAESLAPADSIELSLAERVASALWRLKRATRYEDAVITLNLEAVEQDVVPDVPGGIPTLRRRLVERRQEAALLQRFSSIPDTQCLSAEEALTIILAVAAQSDAVDADHLTLPTSPGDPSSTSIYQVDSWTAATVRALLASIASANRQAHAEDDRDASALAEDAAAAAEDAAHALHKEITAAELAAARLARERCVPPPDAVDRIIRYEAHVGKQLTTALHELEALQKRRSGQDAPLYRGDISGDPEAISAKRTP